MISILIFSSELQGAVTIPKGITMTAAYSHNQIVPHIRKYFSSRRASWTNFSSCSICTINYSYALKERYSMQITICRTASACNFEKRLFRTLCDQTILTQMILHICIKFLLKHVQNELDRIHTSKEYSTLPTQ